MKIICESCETSFKPETIKGMTNCPICGAAFDNVGEEVEVEEEEGSLMYFDKIMLFDGYPESNYVRIYCRECKTDIFLELNNFNETVDKKYVILKEGVIIKCKGCGKEHKPRKILYRKMEKKLNTSPSPRCPVCGSTMLKKITLTSKVMTTAVLGVFANPHNSKTYECKSCGYKF